MPGITFHGIRTPSWDSSSRNSAIFGILNSFVFLFSRFGWEFEFPFKLVESVGVRGL